MKYYYYYDYYYYYYYDYYYFIAIIKILELYYMFVVLTVWSGRLIFFFLLFSVDNPVKSSLTDRHVENITI